MQWISKLSRAHVVLAVAALLTFVSTFAYLRSLDETIKVAQLTHSVTSGSRITDDDIEYVEIADDEIVAGQTFTHSQIKSHELVARIDLSKTDLLTKSNTVRASNNTELQSLSLGVDLDRANGGELHKKDLVDIWQTGEEAQLVAQSIPVRNIVTPGKRLGVATSKTLTLVLAVTPEQAQALSPIVGSKDIMIVLSTGTPTDVRKLSSLTTTTAPL